MKTVLSALLSAWCLNSVAGEILVATVNNAHMITMQRLTPWFEKAHPGVRVRWVVLDEGALRQQVTADIARRGGRFDVVTIGAYEAPIWGRRGWLRPIEVDRAYDVDDLLPAVREGLSVKGVLYAAPFYGESSMTMARADLLAAKGLSLPERPTWGQIRQLAARLHDPSQGVYGLCLRGKPGWGENMSLVTTMVNTFGGQWFDMDWRPRLTSRAWHDAVSMYVDLMRRFGPPGAVANGYNENLALFSEGRCALWIDATVAGAFVSDPARSRVAGTVRFARAPTAVTARGAQWLWSWALAVPSSTTSAADAQAFVRWATSRQYVELVAREEGWGKVPSGTRRSTYERPHFLRASPWAVLERQAITSADPRASTLPPSPYVGIQFVAIPEFQAIGTAVGQQIGSLLTQGGAVGPALARAQRVVERKMDEAGYRDSLGDALH